jgi:hypothetical protein
VPQSADFRTLANMRAREALFLLRGSQWSGAYYLAGYAIECAFKAYLAKEFRSWCMPDKNKVTKAHIHNLLELAGQCNLAGLMDAHALSDPVFSTNWATVKDWSEESRYRIWTEIRATDMCRAVNDRNHGVLAWVKSRW